MSRSEKTRVVYYYDESVGDHMYDEGHPMKPFRIRMTNDLVNNYGLYKHMEYHRPRPAEKLELTQFHTDDYITFLSQVTEENAVRFEDERERYGLVHDCPVFEGLYDFSSLAAGGSTSGAGCLNHGKCDIAVNWTGGLHHAKKDAASGFCYVNDIVLGILELLRFHKRVLYIDIDVHHGDGVEEAFFTTDRVMCLSLHKFDGHYFPGTGNIEDVGVGNGKHYSVNVPLRDGIDAASYKAIFEPVVTAIMKYFQPQAIVLQCGTDSLSGDRLGTFNLSMEGHADCVKFVKKLGLPLLVLGGGGYTVSNVAKAWAFETGVLLGIDHEMDRVLPYNDYYSYYGPHYRLEVPAAVRLDFNTPEYLTSITARITERLRGLNPVPSVQLTSIPPPISGFDDDDGILNDADEDQYPDLRSTTRRRDRMIENGMDLMPDTPSGSFDENLSGRARTLKNEDPRRDMHGDSPFTANTVLQQNPSSRGDRRQARRSESHTASMLDVPSASIQERDPQPASHLINISRIRPRPPCTGLQLDNSEEMKVRSPMGHEMRDTEDENSEKERAMTDEKERKETEDIATLRIELLANLALGSTIPGIEREDLQAAGIMHGIKHSDRYR